MSRILFSMLFLSCSSLQKIAVDQLTPALSNAVPKLAEEKSWDYFRSATPASLQLMEVLLQSSKQNLELLATLNKSFASYGYIVEDTILLRERLRKDPLSQQKLTTIAYFAKGTEYGFRYLAQKNIDLAGITNALKEDKIFAYFDVNLSSNSIFDLETSFFTGMAWLMLANLQRENLLLVSQITAANAMIEWTCKWKPDFQNGLCPTLQAVYHLSRPKMLGGKPELAKEMLEKALKDYPDNLLIPITMIEYSFVPSSDTEAYNKLKAQIEAKIQKAGQVFYAPGAEIEGGNPEVNLFNAMAARRLEVIVGMEKDLF